MLEDKIGNDSKHHQRDAFLDDFQLNQVEGTAVVYKADAISRHLTAILEKGNHPRECYDQIKRPVGGNARLLEAQVAIPSESHEYIAHNEQQNCINTICHEDGNLKTVQNY